VEKEEKEGGEGIPGPGWREVGPAKRDVKSLIVFVSKRFFQRLLTPPLPILSIQT